MARVFAAVATVVAMGVCVSGCSSKHAKVDETPDSGDSGQDQTGKDGTGPDSGDDDSAPPQDTSQPDSVSVAALANTSVRVLFSEAVVAATVIVANFHIQGAAAIVVVEQASLGADGVTVTLTVAAGMQQGATYTLLVQGVGDTHNNIIGGATKDFSGRGAVVAELSGIPNPYTNTTSASVTVGGVDIVAYQFMTIGPGQSESWSAETPVATLINVSASAEGLYTLQVVGKDSLGNWQGYDEATVAVWAVDTTPPVATFKSTPASITSSSTADFVIAGDDVQVYEFSLDGGAWSDSAGVASAIEISGIAEGSHTLSVVGQDLAGNWQSYTSPTSYTWTIESDASVAVLGNLPTDPTRATAIDISVSGVGVVSYTYSLDGGGAVAVADTATDIVAAGLGEGEHTLSVTGSDAGGDAQTTPTEYTWTIDLTPPIAVLSGLPNDPTNATTAHILVGGAGVASYRYSLDGGALGGVYLTVFTLDLTSLTEGPHALSVFGIDAAGNVQTIATTFSWTIDTTPPVAQLPAITSPSDSASLTVSVSGVVAYKYALDSGAWSSETDVSVAIAITALSEGSHTLDVIGRDAAGNWQDIASPTSRTWVVDLTPPVATLTGLPPELTSTTSLDVTVGNCVAYEVSLDGAGYSTETSASIHITASSLGDGDHALDVVGRDAAGNWQTAPTSYAWTVDTTAPADVTLTGVPANPSNNAAPSIGVTGTGIVGYEYQVDGGTWTSLIGIGTPITLSLGEGTHTLAVSGQDAAGNLQASPTTITWTVDLTPPVATLSGVPASLTNQNSASITVGNTASYEYSLDGGAYTALVDASLLLTLSSLTDTTHSLNVLGVDAAGNVQTTPTHASWTVDTVAPSAPAVTAAASTVTTLAIIFNWTNSADVAEAAIQVATDAAFTHIVFGGASGASVGTAQTYTYVVDADDGAIYYARVRVRDTAQNWSAYGTPSSAVHVVGGVTGTVESSNLVLIGGATVVLQSSSGTTLATTTTTAAGVFTFSNIDIGTNAYKLAVSATGFNGATKSNVTVSVGATTDVGFIYVVSSSAAPGTITGNVVDANKGAAQSAITVTVLDWTGTVAATTTTSSTGAFTTTTLSPGTYTVVFSNPSFFDLDVDNVVVNGNTNIGQQALCQVLVEPQVRAVLLWGSNPRDLDLHVVGPTAKTASDGAPTNRFHIWYDERSWDENTGKYTAAGNPDGTSSTTSLVQDDTTSFGPEAINLFGHGTGYAFGTYTWSVYDYSEHQLVRGADHPAHLRLAGSSARNPHPDRGRHKLPVEGVQDGHRGHLA